MTSQASLFDVCATKHRGNAQSRAANLRINPHKAGMREQIRTLVIASGYYGATLKEICAAFGKLPHQVSGRISEAKAAGELFDSGRDRDGCAVLVARQELANVR